MAKDEDEDDAFLSDYYSTGASSISSNNYSIGEAYARSALLMLVDHQVVVNLLVLLNVGVLCFRYLFCWVLIFEPSQVLPSVQCSSVYCLVWLEKFCTWFGIKREIEGDKYSRHAISKHSEKCFHCYSTLAKASDCGTNSDVARRIPKNNFANDPLL